MRGQASTELLVIMGFMIFLLIPTIIYAYYKVREFSNSLELEEMDLTAARLAYLINALGASGDNNAIKLEFILPESVHYMAFKSYGYGGEVLIYGTNYTISYPTTFPIYDNMTYLGGHAYKVEFYSLNGAINVNH